MQLDFERSYYENPELWEPDSYTIPEEVERTLAARQWIPPDVESILDIGCGNGVLINQLQNTRLVVGLDRSQAALHWVQTLRCQGAANSLPFVNNTFDITIAMEVIEHLPQFVYIQSLTEMVRVSRRYILIAVPYREKLDRKRITCPVCHYQFHAHLHIRSFDAQDMENLFGDWENIALERLSGIVSIKTPIFAREWQAIRCIGNRNQSKPIWNFVCPQCGHSNIGAPSKQITVSPYHSLLARVKTIWPKTTTYGWWLALYAKNKFRRK